MKCPVVVPSPLSCRVSEHLSRAACSSDRMSSFSWASTTCWSGSMASIARRASRRSWSGLNRVACSTRWASTTWRCSSLTVWVVGPWRARSPRHDRARPGRHRGPRRWRRGPCPARWPTRPARAASDRDTVVVFATQASVSVNPASLRGPGLVGGRDQLELERLEPTDRTVHLRDHAPAGSRMAGATCSRSMHSVQVRDSSDIASAVSGWRSRSAVMGTFCYEHMFESRVESECGQRK